MESIEQISWHTTGNRHYGWVPDWKEREENNERLHGVPPEDGVQALAFIPPSRLTEPNNYASSIDGADMMKDPDFCQHEALRNGPVAKAGLCIGNIFLHPRDSDTIDIARCFFEALNMHSRNGECYSLASVALAMAGATLKDTILPMYEMNKETEAASRLQQ